MFSFNFNSPIEFDGKSFSTFGGDNSVQRLIRQERDIACTDLADTYFDINFDYSGDQPAIAEKLLISRSERKIILQVLGRIGNSPPPQVLAKASLKISSLLSIAKAYLEHHGASVGEIPELKMMNDSNAIADIDAERQTLHLDFSFNIEKQLRSQPIHFAAVNRADKDKYAGWRYLSTAILMHILPARVFEEAYSLVSQARPKHDGRTRIRSAKVQILANT
jgi:hypothetical protein